MKRVSASSEKQKHFVTDYFSGLDLVVSYKSLSLICNKEFCPLLIIEGIFCTNFLGVLSGGFFWIYVQ